MPLGSLEEREGKLQKKKKIESDAANQPHLRFGDRDESEGKGDWGRDAPSWTGSGDKKKAGSDEGCGGISGARPGGGGGEGDSGSKTLVSSRREAEGKRAGEPSTENDRTERV